MRINIESEGFILKSTYIGNPNVYTKPYPTNPYGFKDYFVNIIYNEFSEWVCICQGDNETPLSDWKTIFAGHIRNQEDFKKVLTMILR